VALLLLLFICLFTTPTSSEAKSPLLSWFHREAAKPDYSDEATQNKFVEVVSYIGKNFTEHSAFQRPLLEAQASFDQLLQHGSPEVKEGLRTLAFELHKLLHTPSWSRAPKLKTIYNFLRDNSLALTKAVAAHDGTNTGSSFLPRSSRLKVQEGEVEKLYKNLRLVVRPAVKSVQDMLKGLPYKKMAVAGSALAAIAWARRGNNWKQLKGRVRRTFNILDHLSDSMAENERAHRAFIQTIEPDATAEGKPTIKHKAGKTVYLKRGQDAGVEDNWVEAPKGFGDRALDLAERGFSAAKGIAPHLKESLKSAAAEQRRWYEEHQIPADTPHTRFVRAEVGPGDFEMRYATTVPYENQTPGDEEKFRKSLWKNPADDVYYETFLPDRNLGERTIGLAEKAVTLAAGPEVRGFISALTTQMTDSRQELMDWLKSNDLLNDDAKGPNEINQKALLNWNREKKILFYQRKRDGAIIEAPKSTIDKLMGGVTALTKKDSNTNAFLGSLARTMDVSHAELAAWLWSKGLSDKVGSTKLREGAKRLTAPSGRVYYLLPGDADEEVNRIDGEISPTAHLFNSIGKLDKPGTPVAKLVEDVLGKVEHLQDFLAFQIGRIPLASEAPKAAGDAAVADTAVRYHNYLKRRRDEIGAEVKTMDDLYQKAIALGVSAAKNLLKTAQLQIMATAIQALRAATRQFKSTTKQDDMRKALLKIDEQKTRILAAYDAILTLT